MADLTISGKTFTIEPRYSAGHVLNENEASALNQTMFENIRNNLAKAVREGEDSQESVTAYAQAYEFGVRRTGPAKAPVDPVEREALRVAVEKVKESIRKAGLSNIPAARINERAEQALASDTHGPALRKIAKQRLDALAKLPLAEDDFAAGLESGPTRSRKAAEAVEAEAA